MPAVARLDHQSPDFLRILLGHQRHHLAQRPFRNFLRRAAPATHRVATDGAPQAGGLVLCGGQRNTLRPAPRMPLRTSSMRSA